MLDMPDHRSNLKGQDNGWRPVKKLRTHEYVLAAVEEQILSGRLKPGDKLPGERELSELLGVSRPSVREAMRALESLGIVTAAAGSGKKAGSTIANEPSIALSYFLRAHVGLANFKFTDVIETRIALERATAEAAAERATAEDLEAFHKLLDEMRADRNPGAFYERDSEFHVAIAKASGNAMLSSFMEAVRGAIRQQMVSATANSENWDEIVDDLIPQHEKIATAIEKGEAQRAGDLIVDHIRDFYKRAGLLK
jgi:GntR family transcriptional regulator, transcriptional repressor for pyruvate dehydrogenase complex